MIIISARVNAALGMRKGFRLSSGSEFGVGSAFLSAAEQTGAKAQRFNDLISDHSNRIATGEVRANAREFEGFEPRSCAKKSITDRWCDGPWKALDSCGAGVKTCNIDLK